MTIHASIVLLALSVVVLRPLVEHIQIFLRNAAHLDYRLSILSIVIANENSLDLTETLEFSQLFLRHKVIKRHLHESLPTHDTYNIGLIKPLFPCLL